KFRDRAPERAPAKDGMRSREIRQAQLGRSGHASQRELDALGGTEKRGCEADAPCAREIVASHRRARHEAPAKRVARSGAERELKRLLGWMVFHDVSQLGFGRA